MIYLIISEDAKYVDKPIIRVIDKNKKLRDFYLVTYFKTEDEAADFCRVGGKFLGTQENRFWYYKLEK